MSITSSGLQCDVCGKYILPLGDVGHAFTVNGIEQKLHADSKCKELLQAITNWNDLPDGPLKTVFKEATDE